MSGTPRQPRASFASRVAGIRMRAVSVVLRESRAGQGTHIDPERTTIPPLSTEWSSAWHAAASSPRMEKFADTLRPPTGGSVRDGVVDDLARYYSLRPEQVIERCLHWEAESVAEWRTANAAARDQLAEFYNSIKSWSFDLLWFGYLQAQGYAYPKHVVIADQVQLPSRARVLDFGSGVGVTSQLFAALGHRVDLADVSAPLLNFAQWRLEERGVKADYHHLPTALPDHEYDLITAMDTLVHVPDPQQTARELYKACRPGGHLAANFDVRRRSEENVWHLYEDDLPLRWAVERSGFVPIRLIDGMIWIYQARPMSGLSWRLRLAGAWLRLASPPARMVRAGRRAGARVLVGVLQWRARRA
jgi:SAM-dependent methyltransferase